MRPPRSTCWVPAGRLAQAAGWGEDSGRQGLWGDAQSCPAVTGGAESRGRRVPRETRGSDHAAHTRRPGLYSDQQALWGVAELSPRKAAVFRLRGARRDLAQLSIPLPPAHVDQTPSRPLPPRRCLWSLICRLWGPTSSCFLSQAKFYKEVSKEKMLPNIDACETEFGIKCHWMALTLQECTGITSPLLGTGWAWSDGATQRVQAPPDPMKSLSRGTWTVADSSPAPGELKTPPGNCPSQMGRVRCRLIKGLARGQRWGGERGNESLSAENAACWGGTSPESPASLSSEWVGKLEPGARFLDVPAQAATHGHGLGGGDTARLATIC